MCHFREKDGTCLNQICQMTIKSNLFEIMQFCFLKKKSAVFIFISSVKTSFSQKRPTSTVTIAHERFRLMHRVPLLLQTFSTALLSEPQCISHRFQLTLFVMQQVFMKKKSPWYDTFSREKYVFCIISMLALRYLHNVRLESYFLYIYIYPLLRVLKIFVRCTRFFRWLTYQCDDLQISVIHVFISCHHPAIVSCETSVLFLMDMKK